MLASLWLHPGAPGHATQRQNAILKFSLVYNHWYIDSRAAKHMTCEKDSIVDFIKYEEASKTYLGDNRVIEAYGQGKERLSRYEESDAVQLTLNKAL